MESTKRRPVHHTSVAARVVEGEAIIVLPAQGEVLVLNGIGSRVWELADGSRTLNDIVGVIVSEYETPAQTAMRDVREFLTTLEARQAITLEPETTPEETP